MIKYSKFKDLVHIYTEDRIDVTVVRASCRPSGISRMYFDAIEAKMTISHCVFGNMSQRDMHQLHQQLIHQLYDYYVNQVLRAIYLKLTGI